MILVQKTERKVEPRDYLCLDIVFMKWSRDTVFSPRDEHRQNKHVHCMPTDLAVEIVNLGTFYFWYCGLTMNIKLSMNDVRIIFNHVSLF